MNFSLFVLVVVAVLSDLAFARKAVAGFQATRKLSPRIIGGQEANAGQFPSAAAIYASTPTGTYFCGGTLVSNQFVLTAAHCITGGTAFQIRLGSNTLTDIDPNRLLVTTSVYFTHPAYNPDTLEADVGLIKFHLPIEFTDYIQPVYLPTVDQADNMGNLAIGWGSVNDETPSLSNTLNYVSVTSVSNTECQLSYSNPILATMVCVIGNYNEGACRGDSGSPLLTVLNHHHWIVGVASFISTDGCETSDPSGYTRIFPYIDWVRTTAGIP
ncbi:brachyurin-like [Zophobas morio]|uniref:brachyurin-like n=1 Tax=Zophobas morio TaxID=2755281 RepID=UPI003083A3E5